VDDFITNYHEKKTLLINRRLPQYYADLISIERLNKFFELKPPHHTRVVATNALKEISSSMYLRPDKRVDISRLFHLFSDGATIVFRQMQDLNNNLRGICSGAEQVFNWPFQANVYLSPPHAQGLEIHHDTHDVFILQVVGTKCWRVYDPAISLPLPGQKFHESMRQVRPMVEEITLQPGDLFYCPRGVPHDARATSDPSLHVSLGGICYTWAELMIEVMADVCLKDSVFRASLPPGFAMNADTQSAMEATFRGLIRQFCDGAQLKPALLGIVERFVASRNSPSPDINSQIFDLNSLSLESWVGGKPGLIYQLNRMGKTTCINFCSVEIKIPSVAHEAIIFALETPRYQIARVPGSLANPEKMTLIRRLIREGLVIPEAITN
jgi:hypothetical protein